MGHQAAIEICGKYTHILRFSSHSRDSLKVIFESEYTLNDKPFIGIVCVETPYKIFGYPDTVLVKSSYLDYIYEEIQSAFDPMPMVGKSMVFGFPNGTKVTFKKKEVE